VVQLLVLRSVHTAGMQYRRHCRRPLDDPGAPPSEHDSMNVSRAEEVLLEQDELAGGGPLVVIEALLPCFGLGNITCE
jgi:hypothetical protein